MNKLTAVIINPPTKAQSPDRRNKNKIVYTSVQINNIKRYLNSIKKHHHTQHHHKIPTPQPTEQHLVQNAPSARPPPYSSKSFPYPHTPPTESIQILRQRILQLQLQNNQFRILSQQYQSLALRNQYLQSQMQFLLSELQQQSSSPLRNLSLNDSNIKPPLDHSTIQNFRTEESSKEESLEREVQPNSFRNQSSEYIEQGEPFQYVNVDQQDRSYLIEENSFLKAENKQIKEMIEQEVRTAITSLQLKFKGYVTSMEQKIAEIKITNEQILKLKLNVSDSSSSLEQKQQKKSVIRLNNSRRSRKSSSIPNLQEYSNRNGQVPPTPSPDHNSAASANQINSSLVNIQIDNLSESQHSFGKSAQKPRDSLININMFDSEPYFGKSARRNNANPPPNTPEYFAQIQVIQSQTPNPLTYYEQTSRKIMDSLESVRQNLTFLLAEQSSRSEINLEQFQNKVYQKIQYIISVFFPHKANYISFSHEHDSNEGIRLREKINELNQEVYQVNSQLKSIKSSRYRPDYQTASDRYLQGSYYESISPSVCSPEFEQTQHKLIKIISIMRSFNQQYHHMLERSRTYSLQQQTPHQSSIKIPSSSKI